VFNQDQSRAKIGGVLTLADKVAEINRNSNNEFGFKSNTGRGGEIQSTREV